MLATKAHRDDRREAAYDQALRVDQHPLLVDVGGLSVKVDMVSPCEFAVCPTVEKNPAADEGRRDDALHIGATPKGQSRLLMRLPAIPIIFQ